MTRSLSAAFARLRRIGLPRFGRSASDPRGVILAFHEIQQDDELYRRELNVGCTVAFLESTIIQLRRNRWDIVSLDEALVRLDDDDRSRRFAVLTFDDGYRDTLTCALPILERLEAPFTIYVSTGALTRELNCWWLGLRALFQRHDEVSLPELGRLACADMQSKIARCAEARQWVHRDYRRVSALAETFRRYGISLHDLNDDYFMDPAQLRRLGHHPLARVGGHTSSHTALSLLGAADMEREMSDNRSYLDQLLDRSVQHLAYPYGNLLACGEREFRAAGTLGFRTAVTALHAPVFAQHRQHPQRMPRVGLSGMTSHLDYVAGEIRKLRHASQRDYPEERL